MSSPVVLITAFGTLDTAIAAIRAGAYDFITKPIEIEALAVALERAVERRRLRKEVSELRRAVGRMAGRFGKMLGSSDAMRPVYDVLERIADSPATVLVTGESGTGKEVVARALHDTGPRKAKPFVAINCSAVPEALLESELFGHARGAFTDARAPRTGLMLQANGGTLLLDEIGDMPMPLRRSSCALQERTVRPVGGDAEVPFDVRVVATTNRDLRALIDDARFREDLYFRINVIHIELPPLRARGGGVLVLAQRSVDLHATRAGKTVTGLTPPAAERLLAYPWPGNVRELQNCIERAIALTHPEIQVEDLPENRSQLQKRSHVLVAASDPSELVPLAEVERRYVLRVVKPQVVTNRSRHRSSASRGTLYRKLEEYGQPIEDDGLARRGAASSLASVRRSRRWAVLGRIIAIRLASS
jgi:two-component system response regulator HydG